MFENALTRLLSRILVVSMSMLAISLQAREDVPDHDITLFDLTVTEAELAIANPQVITNKVGYDNQPKFIDNQSLYFTSMEDINADIWHWQQDEGRAGTIKQLTKTLESEYSPTPVPHKSGSFSTIRVEHDGTQRLWQVNEDGSFELLFKDVKPVGYHVWQGQDIAMFVLGEPHRLEIATLGQETTKVIDKSIGRCLANVPGSDHISYTVEVDGKHQLKTYNFAKESFQTLITLPNNSQDYAWLDSDTLISSNGTNLLWRDLSGENWQKVTVPEGTDFKSLSRIAISPDMSKIALVDMK